jgi:hypothetical protein
LQQKIITLKANQLPNIMRSCYIPILIVITFACNNSGDSTTKKKDASTPPPLQLIFDKLTGVWQNEDGKSFERWTKNDHGSYRAVGFSIKGNDTSWNEQADIYQENGKWIFENTVKGQNEGKAVKFTSTFLNETSVQFSNSAHDSPTVINYTVTDDNTLWAFIVGPNNKGGKDTIPFNYIRVK